MEKKNIYVAIVALIDWQGKVLISLRDKKNKNSPNLWEFPGGKSKINESPDETVVREIKEELSLDINKKSLNPLNFNSYSYDTFHATIFFYICRSLKGIPTSKENQKILWVEINKLKNYKFLPGSNKFLLDLNNLMKK